MPNLFGQKSCPFSTPPPSFPPTSTSYTIQKKGKKVLKFPDGALMLKFTWPSDRRTRLKLKMEPKF